MADKYVGENGLQALLANVKSALAVKANTSDVDTKLANKVENYVVTLTENGSGYTASNWQGLEAAYNANKRIYLSAQGALIPLVMLMSGAIAAFYLTLPQSDSVIQCYSYIISLSDGTVTASSTDYEVPTMKFVTASAAPTNADSNTITFVV